MSVVSMAPLPPLIIGSGALGEVARYAGNLSKAQRVLIVADRFWLDTSAFSSLVAGLESAGIIWAHFAELSSEPKTKDIMTIVEVGREAGVDLVIGLGGGAALDAAKIATCCLPGEADPEHYGFGINPLPDDVFPSILIPTTAGTGSEANNTAIFTTLAGKKSWIYGRALTTQLAVLDPDLTASLPPHLTASCGMDALVHAFESATNNHANPVCATVCHSALRLICGALPRAVADPNDVAARQDMLLASFYAGYGICNAGTAVAHNVSHALAGLHPVAHGHATALAFEQSLGWVTSMPRETLDQAAAACGTTSAGLGAFMTDLMDRCGIERRLPDAFGDFDVADLVAEMKAPENAPMRNATLPPLTDGAMEAIAQNMLALAKVAEPA